AAGLSGSAPAGRRRLRDRSWRGRAARASEPADRALLPRRCRALARPRRNRPRARDRQAHRQPPSRRARHRFRGRPRQHLHHLSAGGRMRTMILLALLVASAPATARDAPWLVTVPVLEEAARALAGP